jgi:hypothetical protein
LASVFSIFSLKAKQKDIKMTQTLDASIPQTIVLDGARLRQILINLVGNSVKFTEQGMISVEAWSEISENTKKLWLRVSDSGKGISPDFVPSLFEAFAQDVNNSSSLLGTGLGLSICRTLTRLMGGDSWLEKTECGKGTSFRIDVQFSLPEISSLEVPGILYEEKEPMVDGKLPRIRILIADDNFVNQKLCIKSLSPIENVELSTCSDGKEALEIVQKEAIQDSNPFDIILMDIQMPKMNGLEANVCNS